MNAPCPELRSDDAGDEADVADAVRCAVCEWLIADCGEEDAYELDELVLSPERYDAYLQRFHAASVEREGLDQPVMITLYPDQEPRLYAYYSAVQYARLPREVPLARLKQMHGVADSLPPNSSMRHGYFDGNMRDREHRERARLLTVMHLQRFDPEADGHRRGDERRRADHELEEEDLGPEEEEEEARKWGATCEEGMEVEGEEGERRVRRKRRRSWGCANLPQRRAYE